MAERFTASLTSLEGLCVLRRHPLVDERGYLERMFCQTELAPWLGSRTVRQVNHTLTKKRGTIRGMHWQKTPHREMKFVSCLRGEVFDVAVDLRVGSPTYGRWHGEILSADNMRTLLIPEGFAHGFQTLTDDCELFYFHTADFAPNAEAGINAKDPTLAIVWPLPMTETSLRDEGLPFLKDLP